MQTQTPRACVPLPPPASPPSPLHLSSFRSGPTDEYDRGRLSVSGEKCVWLESEREARLSICLVNLAARLPPCLPSVRSYQHTATEATRPSVRPSVHSLPRGVQLVSERSRWSTVQGVRLRLIRPVEWSGLEWSRRFVGSPRRGKDVTYFTLKAVAWRAGPPVEGRKLFTT